MTLPTHLHIKASELAWEAIEHGFDVDTVQGITKLLQLLARTRPNLTDFLDALNPDELLDVLDAAGSSYAKTCAIIAQIG